jgi:amidase
MSWEKIAADKRARIEASIPQEWRIKTKPTEDSVMNFPKTSGIMSAEELAITESSATDLVAQMAAGKLTSVAVTTAFCKRAALAHQLVYFTPFEVPLYLLIGRYSSIAPLSSSPRWH